MSTEESSKLRASALLRVKISVCTRTTVLKEAQSYRTERQMYTYCVEWESTKASWHIPTLAIDCRVSSTQSEGHEQINASLKYIVATA